MGGLDCRLSQISDYIEMFCCRSVDKQCHVPYECLAGIHKLETIKDQKKVYQYRWVNPGPEKALIARWAEHKVHCPPPGHCPQPSLWWLSFQWGCSPPRWRCTRTAQTWEGSHWLAAHTLAPDSVSNDWGCLPGWPVSRKSWINSDLGGTLQIPLIHKTNSSKWGLAYLRCSLSCYNQVINWELLLHKCFLCTHSRTSLYHG